MALEEPHVPHVHFEQRIEQITGHRNGAEEDVDQDVRHHPEDDQKRNTMPQASDDDPGREEASSQVAHSRDKAEHSIEAETDPGAGDDELLIHVPGEPAKGQEVGRQLLVRLEDLGDMNARSHAQPLCKVEDMPASGPSGPAGRGHCVYPSSMNDDPRERPPAWREKFLKRLVSSRDVVWSWLTDPAVLVYRKHGFGQKRARATVVEFFLFLREVVREFWAIEATARAASLAYTTLLSLIPLLVAFSYYLKSYFDNLFPGFKTQIDTVLNAVLPYQSPQIIYHLTRFTENAGTASTLGAVVFMFIAFRLFLAVEGAVNQIWKVRSARGYRQKIIAFTMLFFWGPLLMGLSFTTTQMLQRNRYLRVLFEGDFIFMIAPVAVLLIGFTMLFWLVPSARVRLPAAMIGALVTTALFTLVRYGFGVYADYLMSGRLNIIYGAVGLAIIFLIALEVMWIVILLGVEVSYVWQNLYGVLRASVQQVEDQPQFDLYFALRALIEIARRFDRREEPPSTYRLAEQFGTTDPQMLRILRKLEDAKLITPTGGDWIGFVPACDPDRITVEEVVAHMEGVQRVVPEAAAEDRERLRIESLFDSLNASTASALDRLTIGRLTRELYSPRAVREPADGFAP